MRLSLPAVFLLFSTPLVKAALNYQYATQNCYSESAGLGDAVYCCSGACLDGTRIGEPGQCLYYTDLCGDVGSGVSCAANQILSYNDVAATVDSGDGCCGACCCECQYQRNNWTYTCCDCPTGYVAVDNGACDAPSNQCIGCSDPNETLEWSQANNTWVCNVYESETCRLASAASTFNTWFGYVDSALGAFCPANIPGSIINLLTDAINTGTYISSNPGDRTGATGAGIGLASGFVTTFTNWQASAIKYAAEYEGIEIAAGAVAIGIAPELAAGYETICTVLQVANVASTVAGAALNAAKNSACPPTTSKRSAVSDFASSALDLIEARDSAYNPCAEFLLNIPQNLTLLTEIHDLSVSIEDLNPTDSPSAAVVNVTTVLQEIRLGFYPKYNGSFLDNWTSMVVALQAFAPYCTNSTNATTSSSSSTSTSTSTSTTISSSTTTTTTTTTTTSSSSSSSSSSLLTSSTTTSSMTSSATTSTTSSTSSSSKTASSSSSSSTTVSSSSTSSSSSKSLAGTSVVSASSSATSSSGLSSSTKSLTKVGTSVSSQSLSGSSSAGPYTNTSSTTSTSIKTTTSTSSQTTTSTVKTTATTSSTHSSSTSSLTSIVSSSSSSTISSSSSSGKTQTSSTTTSAHSSSLTTSTTQTQHSSTISSQSTATSTHGKPTHWYWPWQPRPTQGGGSFPPPSHGQPWRPSWFGWF